MNLDHLIRNLAEEGTKAALGEYLPGILAQFIQPADPDERLTVNEAAEALRMPVKTVRQRITEGKLLAFRDGIRLYVLRSDLIAYNRQLREAAQRERDVARLRARPTHVDADIYELLAPVQPKAHSRKKSSGKKG